MTKKPTYEELEQKVRNLKEGALGRVRAEEALRESEERYRSLIENAHDMIQSVRPDGSFEFVNRAWLETLGYTEAELASLNLFDIIHPDSLQHCQEAFSNIMAGQRVTDIQATFVAKDGKAVSVEGSVSPRFIEGKVIATHGIFRDISERKLAQEALQKAHDELEKRVEERTAELSKTNKQLMREIEKRKRVEEEWEKTFNAVPDLISILDNNYRIVRPNRAMTDRLGMILEETVGMPCCEIICGEKNPPPFCPYARLLADGKEHTEEIYNERLDGDFLVSVSTLHGRKGELVGAVHVARDISELNRAKRNLVETKTLLDNVLLYSGGDAVMATDMDMRILLYNQRAKEFFGYGEEEVIGKSAWEMHLKEKVEPERLEQAIRTVRETGVYEYDVHGEFPGGNDRWFHSVVTPLGNEKGEQLGYVLNSRDVTEHKKAEEALRESEERYRKLYDESKRAEEIYRSLLHTSADAIAIYDMEGNARYSNPSFTKIFGWTLDEIEGKRIPFLPESEREATMAGIREVVEEGRPIQDFETKRYTKDGRVIDINISASRYDDHEGKPAGMLVVLRNTSERKILEAQLQHSQKMEAIGTLAGGISHDFNNLLQAILGYTQMLLLDKERKDPEFDRLKQIEKGAKRASELTQQLLTFSRKVESKLRPLNLNQEVKQIKKLLKRIIPKMIDIELHLEEDLKIINADSAQMEQVLMNLAVNARDAMPEGGKLIIETKNASLDEEYCRIHLGAKPGDYVLASISDTGHGMDKETVEHIFEPFYTTKETGKGTGLGLAMVYGLVKNHGGYITCYSEPGEGTIFKIYLPIIEKEVEEGPEDMEKAMPRGGSETILLVDDEAFLRDLGEQMLAKFGYTVFAAHDGESALELYRQKKEDFSLVILDLIMPGMGGRRCLEELLKINSQAKIVIASGYSVNGPTREALEAGARGFISKPYDVRKMLKVVREVLDME